MRILLALCLIAPALAQPTKLRTVRATHQQIVISYSAPAGDDCRVEVSESPAYAPVVNDVNPSMFAGADIDVSRPDTHIAGDIRTVVIGKRMTDVTSTNKLSSRSLQANTSHYVRISECGGVATLVAHTTNISWGLLTDAFEADPRAGLGGYYGYPTANYLMPNESFIDPLTGALVRRMAIHEPYRSTLDVRSIGTVTGNNWTDPWRATANNDSTPAKTTTTEILFAPNATVMSDSWSNSSFGQLTLTVRGRITGGATGEDAKVQVSICTAGEILSDWREFSLTGSFASATVGEPTPMSGYWFKAGHPVEGWFHPGGKRGFCLKKKTASGHELQISHLTYSANSAATLGDSTTLPQFCAYSTVTDAGQPGKTFLPCYFADRGTGVGRFYSFETTQGTTTFLGPIHMTHGGTGLGGSFTSSSVVWDRNNSRRFYGIVEGNLFRCDISSKANTLVTPHTGSLATQPAMITAAGCKLMTVSGFKIQDQARIFGHPNWSSFWDSQHFRLAGNWPGNYLAFVMLANGQASGGWVAIYDPAAPNPEQCTSCEGKLIALSSFGATQPGVQHDHRKGCLVHTTNSTDVPGWIALGCARQSLNAGPTTENSFGGPWAIRVQRHSSHGTGSIQPSDTRLQLVAVNGSYQWEDLIRTGSPQGVSIPLEVGDLMIHKVSGSDTDWYGSDELMEVTAIHPDNSISVRRGTQMAQSPWLLNSGYTALWHANTAKTIASNTYLYLKPRSSSLSYKGIPNINWNFLADPLGLTYVQPAHEDNITSKKPFPPRAQSPTPAHPFTSGYASPNVHNFNNFGDHGTHSLGIKLQYSSMTKQFWGGDAGFLVQAGNPNTITQQNGPVTQQVSISPRFAGMAPGTVPAYDTHLKRRQYTVPEGDRNRDHVQDMMPFVTLNQASDLVAGTSTVYRFSGTPVLQRKHYGTAAFVGDRILKDISGPANCATNPTDENCIDDADLFAYCVALVENECRPGSSRGEVFYNSPLRTTRYCSSTDGTDNTVFSGNSYPQLQYGGCVHDLGLHLYGVLQTDVSRDDFAGLRSRRVTRLFQRPIVQKRFAVAYVTPDSDWILFLGENHGMTSWNAVKLPPLPEDSSTDPLTFERVSVDLYHAEAAKFRIEFGYLENGGAKQYRCTTRADTCVVDTARFDDSAPFKWDTEGPGYIPCMGNRCKADIPRVPGRVVYSRAVFYDATNHEIGEQVLPPF
jgi:hypothetical protein